MPEKRTDSECSSSSKSEDGTFTPPEHKTLEITWDDEELELLDSITSVRWHQFYVCPGWLGFIIPLRQFILKRPGNKKLFYDYGPSPAKKAYDPSEAVMSGGLGEGDPVTIENRVVLPGVLEMGEIDTLVKTQKYLTIYLKEADWDGQDNIGISHDHESHRPEIFTHDKAEFSDALRVQRPCFSNQQ
ncbi:hypothetical protein M7I_1307 [Glarea lozoyensis 74030]|uniref:Uncharacterized protein n=1 Tax=Glarea lozoyensis (strain ATCC 74030 / MF5533) TaxID=1104152 RepID=H0EFQ1_GLAL7|nr:hypothetical protein M7I_1307 [Glarea lozoyensis 74030]